MSIDESRGAVRAPMLRRPDAAVVAIVAILAVLAAAAPGQAVASLRFTAETALGLAPFFALSIGLAAWIRASDADSLIARAFTGRPATMVALAALAGALSPFCSCGVIPIVAGLLASGVPLAPVMAFWIASPLMDPSMFVLTLAFLGPALAGAKLIAAIAMGLGAGLSVMALQARGMLVAPPLRKEMAPSDGGEGTRQVGWHVWREPARRARFLAGLRSNGLFLGKWLLLAFLVESLMAAYLPAGLVAGYVGDGSVLSVAAAAIVGVPAYLNGTAALPLVAELIAKGMAPGAAIAFLLAGGVTSIPAAMAVAAVARRAVFASYVVLGFAGALAAGLAVQALLG